MVQHRLDGEEQNENVTIFLAATVLTIVSKFEKRAHLCIFQYF